MYENPFAQNGIWLKANLHSHTTESDGRLSPAEKAIHYRRQGYQVLAITDHSRVTPCADYNARDFICIEGVEVSAGRTETGDNYHVVGVGLSVDSKVPQASTESPQTVLDAIAAEGGVGFIAHPYWSSLTGHDMLGLKNCMGMEVFNYGCEIEIGKGTSSIHWDDCLVRGEKYIAFATDDGHRCGWDFYGGFTMIHAKEFTREAVMQALHTGQCYSSTGPLISDLRIEDDMITVECTPASAINFIANNHHGWSIQKEDRPALTQARYLIGGRERYVRVEVISETGLRAWSQPIWFNEG